MVGGSAQQALIVWVTAHHPVQDHQVGRLHRPGVLGEMAAKFVLKKGSTGKFRFNLVATNGQVIATSEAYESKASAIRGIESVKRNAPTAETDDQTDK
jgi:uncharacterized protein YegP (UPF0339 family)